jgi:hypothetical protein
MKKYYLAILNILLCAHLLAQYIPLTEDDKKALIKNFQTVLQHIPGKFEKLKTGADDWDITNRISWYKSNLQLLPRQADKSKNQLMYGTYNSKPVIAFIEEVPVEVNTIVEILMPVLKAKGMVEVNTKYVMDDPAARSFRSNAAVLQINTNAKKSGTIINIGKFPYYYESDVKPITVTKEPAKAITKPAPGKQKPADEFCNGLKKIIKESGNAFKDVRFNKKESDDYEESYEYETTLPKLGFQHIRILEEEALENEKGIVTIYDCFLTTEYTDKAQAQAAFNKTIAAVNGCLNSNPVLRNSNGVQWYEFEVNENGLLKEVKVSLTSYTKTSMLSLDVYYNSKEKPDF